MISRKLTLVLSAYFSLREEENHLIDNLQSYLKSGLIKSLEFDRKGNYTEITLNITHYRDEQTSELFKLLSLFEII